MCPLLDGELLKGRDCSEVIIGTLYKWKGIQTRRTGEEEETEGKGGRGEVCNNEEGGTARLAPEVTASVARLAYLAGEDLKNFRFIDEEIHGPRKVKEHA